MAKMRKLLSLLLFVCCIGDTTAAAGLSNISSFGSAVESLANSLLNVKQRADSMRKHSNAGQANGVPPYNGNVQIPLHNNVDPRNIVVSPGQYPPGSPHSGNFQQQHPQYTNGQYPNSTYNNPTQHPQYTNGQYPNNTYNNPAQHPQYTNGQYPNSTYNNPAQLPQYTNGQYPNNTYNNSTQQMQYKSAGQQKNTNLYKQPTTTYQTSATTTLNQAGKQIQVYNKSQPKNVVYKR
jgi:hypothetical protein